MPRLAYSLAAAKRLRFPPDIYARYGGVQGSARVPAILPTGPLFREPVRPALLHRAPERRARMHARQPGGEVRIGSEPVEYLRHLADKAHLDVRAGQGRSDKEFAALQRAVGIAQMIGEFAVDARMQGSTRLLQPRNIKIQHQGQHRRAFGIMQPLLVGFILCAIRRRHHRAFAMTANEIIDDRAGLGDFDIAVDDDGRLAERMDFRKLRRRQPRLRIALIAHHLVRRPKLLQQPEDALRARVVEMMERKHGRSPGVSWCAPEVSRRSCEKAAPRLLPKRQWPDPRPGHDEW